jgi:hypothetical protein
MNKEIDKQGMPSFVAPSKLPALLTTSFENPTLFWHRRDRVRTACESASRIPSEAIHPIRSIADKTGAP